MPRKFFVLTTIVAILISCTFVSNKPTSTKPPLNIATISPTIIPTNGISTTTVTSAPHSDSVKQDCLEVLTSMPANYTIKGIIPLQDYKTWHTAFLNLANGDMKSIPPVEQHIQEYAVSPDQKMLAYKIYDKNSTLLIRRDALNNKHKVVLTEAHDFALYYWVNNQELLLGIDGKWMIFNPITQEKRNYSTDDFPNFDTDNLSNYWVKFDPSSSKVIYKNGNIFVVNMDSKQIITKIQDGFDRTPIAAWSPNGSGAAIVGTTKVGTTGSRLGDNVFEINENGKVSQLTYLAEQYGTGFNIYSVSWSPDSRYIAFWMSYPHMSPDNFTWVLAVVDISTKKVTNYCIPTNPYALNGNRQVPQALPHPFWSPNSQQIIVEHRTDNSKYVVLVDITQNLAFQIAQDKVPLGWMITP